MACCPTCSSTRIYIVDKGFKKLVRFFQGSNRYACRECHVTWRENRPNMLLKLKRRKRHPDR